MPYGKQMKGASTNTMKPMMKEDYKTKLAKMKAKKKGGKR